VIPPLIRSRSVGAASWNKSSDAVCREIIFSLVTKQSVVCFGVHNSTGCAAAVDPAINEKM